MAAKGKKKKNNSANKNAILIWVLCALAGGILIGGLSVMIYKDLSGTEQASSGTDKNTEAVDDSKVDELEDGAAYDFEKAGYMKLGKYKGLEADVEPEEDDVYSAMMETAKKNEIEGDNVVKNGDLVKIDFTAKLDGNELEDASDEDAYVMVGKGEYIDDFEKGIIGIENGKKKTVDCKFPSDYDDAELAGKTVQFTIHVKGRFSDGIAEKASDGKYKTIQEYIDYETSVQRQESSEDKGELVWDSLKEDCEIDQMPETILTRAEDDITKQYTNFAELSGTTVEDLLADFGMDENGISEIAQDTVADYMISKTIAAKEGITMEDDFYAKKLAESLGREEGDDEMSVADMEKEYVEQGMGSRPKDDMLVERVKQYVGEQAVEA
ncbi:MAG: FKBP-type peptidyl-prolyl cis-trans isomerase [Roseburia sp.]|nr:FKBP-type peptidyl-prolyl cis-trans isomerase [Roseburia sp.]